MSDDGKPVRRKIAATGQMKQIMSDYFYGLDAAEKDPEERIAWCTSVGPAELLRAMGFKVHFPENHGAMLGASRMAAETIPHANAIGYSPDICSYLTADVGAHLMGISPIAKAYEGFGGEVVYSGKPHLPIYEMALDMVSRGVGREVGKERVLAIGDGVLTDIAGAAAAGLRSVFIASGIHVPRGEALDDGILGDLFDDLGDDRPVAAMQALNW